MHQQKESKMKSPLLVCSLFLLVSLCPPVNCNEIKARNFPGFEGTIAAFGDFNSDKFTDIFLIKSELNQKCFQIILQIPDKTETDKEVIRATDPLKHICVSHPIVSLIPSDFDGDAKMDVAVVFKNPAGRFGIRVFKGSLTEFAKEELYVNESFNITSQPMLMDYNGDMISDLLVTEVNETTGQSEYFVYLGGSEFVVKRFDPLRSNKEEERIQVKESNSNAFIDLDGDGVSDIFLEENGDYYIYYFAREYGYSWAHKKKIMKPKYKTIGASTFCDINSDEKIEHLVPVCKEENGRTVCLIVMFDNRTQTWTELMQEIKVGDDYYLFERTPRRARTTRSLCRSALRHGYVNENGYTDLMALMKSSKDKSWHVVLFSNRHYNEHNISFDITVLNQTISGQPILATFFDLYEDAVIDILVNYRKDGEVKNVHEFKSLTLNDFSDVNFVKILVTGGNCIDGNRCYEQGTYGEDTFVAPYGTNSPGPMVCYQLVNSNSNAMKSCGGQLSQMSNFALQMPYSVFGLGQFANYIERITVSIATGNNSVILMKRVDQIVPDSQIVFIPNPINDPSSWKVKLILTPSDIIYKTLYTLTGICVLLIVIIGVLHRKEMLEDVKEQAEFKKQWPEFRR